MFDSEHGTVALINSELSITVMKDAFLKIMYINKQVLLINSLQFNIYTIIYMYF